MSVGLGSTGLVAAIVFAIAFIAAPPVDIDGIDDIPQSTIHTPPIAIAVDDSSRGHWSPSSQCHRLEQLS